MNTTANTDTSPEALRTRMVDHIQAAGHAKSQPVEDALRTIPRHQFVPDASLEDAYADIAVITKRAPDGAALSCASVPTIVALMLDQLDAHPGDRILEIGAGTGYNAALLAHLTGPAGHVTTIDIDPDVTTHARQALDDTGNTDVDVITRDGALGALEQAPYDRIIVTVGAWDLPPAWWDQLGRHGRLVVPLRWRGQTRSIAFIRDGDRLRSDSIELCGFVPMLGQDGERSGAIDPDGHVTLHWDIDQSVDIEALHGVLNRDQTAAWSGVTLAANESFDGLWLHLTATEPSTCRIAAAPAAVAADLCTPAIPTRTPALVAGDSLAYLATRGQEEGGAERRWELGAIAHGPTGPALAERLVDEIQAWTQHRAEQPTVTVYPAAAAADEPHGRGTIAKQSSRLVVSL